MDDTSKPLPMAFEHSMTVYRAMENQASVEDLNEEGATGLVYDGFTTNLIIKELHFSVPFYTTIIRDLKRMDCIRQLRRGGSTTSSRWLLMQPPTVELFTKMKAIKDTDATPETQRMSDVVRRLGILEEQMGALMAAHAVDSVVGDDDNYGGLANL